MTARAIVSDPDILSGRWRFEGTVVPIAAILLDDLATRAEIIEQYKRVGLTDADITAAEAFAFPPIRETEVTVEFASVTINCECGEDTHKTVRMPTETVVDCVCHRKWKVVVSPFLDESQTGPISPPLD